jgi:hypothetical protein
MKVWTTGAVSIFLGVLVSTATSLADIPADASARAEQLFQEGHALLKQERFPESCQRFQASQHMDPASGTLLALAYCEEKAGRLATAFREYTAAMTLAAREQHAERRVAAAERAAALKPRLSTVTVRVPHRPSPDALLVRQNGQPLDATLWGTPVPVDGGRHVIEAEISGKKTWSVTITVLSEGDHQTVTITAPVEDAADGAPRAASLPPVNAPFAPTSSVEPRDDTTTTLEHVAIGLAVATAVGAGLGTVLALNANSKNDASYADGHCDERGCDTRGIELRNSALSAARLATVAFVVSGALAAGSVTLFVIAERPAGAARAAGEAPGWCAGLRGTF